MLIHIKMVKICGSKYYNEPKYDNDNSIDYSQYFNKYPYELSAFQKYAIEAIVTNNHILITAHTGSGKTLPAEFAIDFFTNKGKKVIYTSPIKALSNQKFYEFSNKFPHISFGIFTGDIKFNPNADVLIVTTEILMNALLNMSDLSLDNVECVIFDEVHYINDLERGKVWEQTIMSLPSNIQMVMLSATLDAPEKFAEWCERIHGNRIVYLSTTNHRVVPLTHYAFITCISKSLKDKKLETEALALTNKLHILQDSKGAFQDTNYIKICKLLKQFSDKRHIVKRQYILNSVCKHMVDNNMLPAICFVLSRKSLEECATEITVPLLEDDSKVPYIVARECEQIIRKLPNYQEYLHLPEYVHMVKLLEKGIAIHHAGIMPVLREMVELLFAKGYIKLLFATETFAVGINMPTKTVLFTDVFKHDGKQRRALLAHEYTQMAGRAGRRGIDTVGHVIHLHNLYSPDISTIKKMMSGVPQKLVSKFKISPQLVLQLNDTNTALSYIQQSMVYKDIQNELTYYSDKANKIKIEMDSLKDNYSIDMSKIVIPRTIYEKKYTELEAEYNECKKNETQLSNTIQTNIQNVVELLVSNNFLDQTHTRTKKGNIALHLREVHELIFAELIDENRLQQLTAIELVGVLSCFTNISIVNESIPKSSNPTVQTHIEHISKKYNEYLDREYALHIDSGINYDMHFELIDSMMKWCACSTEIECKQIIQTSGVFLGEFVKAILKINNIVNELIHVAEFLTDIKWLHILNEVPKMTLKYVATNQSLYL